jgi:hypothetical protein
MKSDKDRSGSEPDNAWDEQIKIVKKMKPPFRPHPSEVRIYEELAATKAQASPDKPLQALLLGVTRELVDLNWPKNSTLFAIDRSELMIREFWPGDIPGQRKVFHGNWFDMSFPESTFDLIMGDGVFNFVSYPDELRKFSSVLAPLLRQEGLLCIRIFNQLTQPEKTEEILQEYRQSQQIVYDDFMYRLATSMQNSVEEGLFMNAYLMQRFLADHGIEQSEIFKKGGLPPPAKRHYSAVSKKPDSRVTYPTDQEFSDQMGVHYDVIKKINGSYSLAHRTPIFVMSPK